MRKQGVVIVFIWVMVVTGFLGYLAFRDDDEIEITVAGAETPDVVPTATVQLGDAPFGSRVTIEATTGSLNETGETVAVLAGEYELVGLVGTDTVAVVGGGGADINVPRSAVQSVVTPG